MRTMAVQFRTQAYVNVLTGDDVVYRFECYSDNLADNEIATPGYSGR